MDPNAVLWQHCLDTAAKSDLGLRRTNNEDSFRVVLASNQKKFQDRGHLFIVADGMGGHAAGELASKLAADDIPLTYHKLVDLPPHEALKAAVRDANAQVHARGIASDDFHEMGTTVSALVLHSLGAIAAHVGDSRIYRLRGETFEQLTFDHSVEWEARAAGQNALFELPKWCLHRITRSVGPNAEVQIDLEGPYPLEPGDTFLLCSDGLSGQVKDEEIGKILAVLPPSEAVDMLVDLANLRGGPDNITVIVAKVLCEQVAKGGAGSAEAGGRSVPPYLWGLLGAFGLGALALLALGQVLFGVISGLAAAAAGIAAVVLGNRPSGSASVFDRPLGKGPYLRWSAAPDMAFVTELSRVAQQLREAAAAKNWEIDWEQFQGHDSRAQAAAQAAQCSDAAREYCRGISFLMKQLRTQGERKADGRAVLE